MDEAEALPSLKDQLHRLRVFNRATKRVIAPFLKIVRKTEKVVEVQESMKFSYYLEKKPSVLLRDLSAFLSDSVDLPSVLHETADVLKVVTNATGVSLYMVNQASNEIYLSVRRTVPDRLQIRYPIEKGTILAAYVALTKEYIMLDDILGDMRFPNGIGYMSETIQAVLCMPIVKPDGDCFAVIEFTKDIFDGPFENDDLKIVVVVTTWMGAAIHQNQQRLALQRQQELNDYLLDLSKYYFADATLIDRMISEIVKFAKNSLSAERGSFFILDKDSGELVADLFDEGDDGDYNLKGTKVKIGKERGIAGLVARTGLTINVKDAYQDPRFSKEIDEKTGFLTRAILCMPIMGQKEILGVVQLVNKKNGGCFNSSDEMLFKTFSIYCALAVRYTKVNSQMQKSSNLNNIYSKLFHRMVKPCIHDFQHFLDNPYTTLPNEFNTFTWYGFEDYRPKMPQAILYILTKIIGNTALNLENVKEFILTVKNLYMENFYHNFDHAFCVCHCMYNMLIRNQDIFTDLESKSLIIAAFTHDVDHPGFTNNFLFTLKDNLSILYKESTLENHHFFVTMDVLNEAKIFNYMTPADYQMIRAEIKDAILATDLTIHFKARRTLLKILKKGIFSMSDPKHRKLLKGIMITSADLCGQCKPFGTAKHIVDCLVEEFYMQGDIEKALNVFPVSIMDREKEEKIPEDQAVFLNVVVIPCVNILRELIPNTEILYFSALEVLKCWQEIINIRGKKVWRKLDSIVHNK